MKFCVVILVVCFAAYSVATEVETRGLFSSKPKKNVTETPQKDGGFFSKKPTKIALGLLGAGAVAYGAHEVYDHYKDDDKKPQHYDERPHQNNYAPTQDQYNRPPNSEYNRPPNSEYNRPPNSEYNRPPTSEYNRRPTSEYNRPPTSEYNRRPTSGYNRPPTSEYNRPPTSEYNRPPQTSGYDRPSYSSQQSQHGFNGGYNGGYNGAYGGGRPQGQGHGQCLPHDGICRGNHMDQSNCCPGLYCHKPVATWAEGRCYNRNAPLNPETY